MTFNRDLGDIVGGMFDGGMFGKSGILSLPQPTDTEGRMRCAGCGVGYPLVTDLRSWPPQSAGLRYCGECRMIRALGKSA